MFTGIIETVGSIKSIRSEGSNKVFWIKSNISEQLKIDQSVSHNGVCLTVTAIDNDCHQVVAIDETLSKSNLGERAVGDAINLERCVKADSRMDGHFVQGHVDDMGICDRIQNKDGSWLFTFKFDPQHAGLLVDKGSITVNGVSLTVINPTINSFQVAIIPYTFEYTNFNSIEKGQSINLEFDIIGKYILRKIQLRDIK